jgi:hypothetical protein
MKAVQFDAFRAAHRVDTMSYAKLGFYAVDVSIQVFWVVMLIGRFIVS